MAIFVVRHGERADYVDRSWVANAERKWDPPLTEEGKGMATRAGAAIRDMCRQHDLAPPSIVLSSPLLRCVETSIFAAEGLGFTGKIGIEAALCETICEDWFRSWALRDSNGMWGGPVDGSGKWVQAEALDVHEAARSSVARLFQSHATFADLFGHDKIDIAYKPAVSTEQLDYTWGKYEASHGTDSATGRRIGGFCDALESKYPGASIVVCTHGGPSAACFAFLTGEGYTSSVGYTSIHLLVRDSEGGSSSSAAGGAGGGWRALVSGSTDHL